MKRLIIVLALAAAIAAPSFAQQKHALVIGNGAYNGISRLRNPVNDANEMEAALKALGFNVEKVLDGELERMEAAVTNLKRRLSASRNSYGFFFYAGHGVQANGENYLIPIEAGGIQSEAQLRMRAVSLQFVMESLNQAGNDLNMVVLDACRDNPFVGWNRSGARGLSVVSGAPTGSIVMYATSANSVASDGSGSNGLFTGQLLKNLKTPGLSVFEVFDKTMGDVSRVTNGSQQPELSLRFSGAASCYLGARPVANAPVPAAPQPAPTPAPRPVQPAPKPATEKEKQRDDYFNAARRNVMSPSAFMFIGSGDEMEWWETLLISLACTRLSGTIQDKKFGLNVELFNINYSFLPFLSVGIGAGGGVTFRDGGQWNWLGVKPYAGITLPLWILEEDDHISLRMFGDGFFEIGYSKWGSLVTGTTGPGFGLNPGFEAGLQFGAEDDDFSLHLEASYGITYYSDKRLKHTIGLTVRFTPDWWY